jgi:translation initiation factor 2-alpha kinase 4
LEILKYFEALYHYEVHYVFLNNINITKIYKMQIKSLDITTSCLYVLMERAQNDWNLEIKRRIIAKKYYKEYEIISILKQVTTGLSFLQKNKIAHRDIKPQNILIFPNNVYKIADMGEAKEINKNRMQMATLRGSELFMSPLLYEGLKYNKKNIRHNPYKSDMFSLGLCFLYAICLNLKILEYIREMKSMNSIKNILAKFLDKNKYSDKLIEIIYKMIDLEEINRFDFEELEKELTNF